MRFLYRRTIRNSLPRKREKIMSAIIGLGSAAAMAAVNLAWALISIIL
ncbi:hypothetical protein [Nocardia farcinica]|nr:hypothetical protein [Nocardia farcinica]